MKSLALDGSALTNVLLAEKGELAAISQMSCDTLAA